MLNGHIVSNNFLKDCIFQYFDANHCFIFICVLLLVPDSGFLRTLDSSIKRNTAVIKKLKQINEEQREVLMDELRNVNLSKFVSEAVTAICDAKLKSSDIQAAVQVGFVGYSFSFLSV